MNWWLPFCVSLFVSTAAETLPYWNGPLPDPSKPAAGLPMIPNSNHSLIYWANHEYGTYNHGPMIIQYGSKFYVSWYNSPQNESQYMRVVYATSEDGGVHWSHPIQMFKNHSTLGLENEPWAIINGRLYGLASSGAYRTHYAAVMRRVEGTKLGPVFWLADKVPTGYKHLDIPTYKQMDERTRKDAALYLSILTDTNVPHGGRFNERSLYKVPNQNRLVLLLRDHVLHESASLCTIPSLPPVFNLHLDMDYCRPGTGIYFNTLPNSCPVNISTPMVSSIVRKCKWSVGKTTTIPDSQTRTCANALPDGRIYLLGSQLPKAGDRDPLTLTLSPDGFEFSKKHMWAVRAHAPPIRFPGHAKGKGFQYPSAMWLRQTNMMFVVYSINKEDIGISRFPLTSLSEEGSGLH